MHSQVQKPNKIAALLSSDSMHHVTSSGRIGVSDCIILSKLCVELVYPKLLNGSRQNLLTVKLNSSEVVGTPQARSKPSITQIGTFYLIVVPSASVLIGSLSLVLLPFSRNLIILLSSVIILSSINIIGSFSFIVPPLLSDLVFPFNLIVLPSSSNPNGLFKLIVQPTLSDMIGPYSSILRPSSRNPIVLITLIAQPISSDLIG